MSEFLTQMSDAQKIDSIVNFHKNFDTMSPEDRNKWLENIGEITVEHFFRANQRAFEEEGPKKKRTPGRREFFLGVIKNKLKSDLPPLPKGHPADNYLQENKKIRELAEKAKTAAQNANMGNVRVLEELLETVHLHYLKKEDALFPYLEKHGFTYPSVGMWDFQDEIRAGLKAAIAELRSQNFGEAAAKLPEFLNDATTMSVREERMILPTAMLLLSNDEWKQIRRAEEEIGFALKPKPPFWQGEETQKPKEASDENTISLDVGSLSIEQIKLVFSHVPFDVTIVDENDRVAFFNQAKERFFSRSPSVIGREVKYCHPPKSLDRVLEIVDAFKKGERDEAEFWINLKGRLIHIRYFALRDKERRYKGVMEITQDITGIKQIEGERRLLDWN